MTRIAVCGIAGRMGQRLAHLVLESEDLELAGGTEREDHEVVGRDAGAAIGVPDLGIEVTSSLEAVAAGADVVIAFTTPEATLRDAAICAAADTSMVVGTTGMSDEQLLHFKETVAPITCVFAPNFSTAMNVLFELVERAARILGEDYDVEVVEDSPSPEGGRAERLCPAPCGTSRRRSRQEGSGSPRPRAPRQDR